MIGQTIVGEVEEDRLILVHVAWNVAGHWIMNEPPGVLISFLQDWQGDVYAELGQVITESFASVYRSVVVWRTLLLLCRDPFYHERLRAVYNLPPYRSCYIQCRDTGD